MAEALYDTYELSIEINWKEIKFQMAACGKLNSYIK